MALPDEYSVSFASMSLAEIQAFGAFEIGNVLNECVVSLIKLARYAQETRGELLASTIAGDKTSVLTAKTRLKDIAEYQRVIRDSKSIFQSLVRSIP